MAARRRKAKAGSGLEVTVRTVGGVFGDDRVTRISNQTMTVTNHGEVETRQELPPAAQAEVAELAKEVAGLTMPPPAESGYVDDGGTTTIEITLPDAQQQRIVLNAGDDAPQPVWDFLDGVDRARQAGDQ
jgi:hypothetical protein